MQLIRSDARLVLKCPGTGPLTVCLRVIRKFISGVQRFFLAGCYDDERCMCVTASGMQVCPQLACNAEEADTRVWLHVMHSTGTRKLLISPDTDVYHNIGLPLCILASPITRLLHLNKLHHDLGADPGLALVPPGLRDRILQTMFICSGCDYVFKLVGFGKVSVMKCFF